jgi:hypothetical protein
MAAPRRGVWLVAGGVALTVLGSTPAFALLDALATIQQFESGGKNITQQLVPTSVSTASGYYQITNSTWNSVIAPGTGLPAVANASSSAKSVKDLTYDQQTQGAAYLFSKQGFQPWTCKGCNATLKQYVADNGGASAFGLTSTGATGSTGLTTSDQDSLGGYDEIAFTATTSGSDTALPAVSSTPSVLSSPFTWAYDQLITSTEATATQDIKNLQTAVGTYSSLLLALALVALCIRLFFGDYIVDRFARFVLKACWVMPFIAVGSSLYQDYVVKPVMGLPAWWQGYLTTTDGYQSTGSSPAALFDWVYNTTYAIEGQIWNATPWSFNAILVAVGLFGAQALVTISLAALFTAYAMLTLLALVLLILGPVCIPFALFAETAILFRNWVWATATLVLSMLAIDILLSLYASVMKALMQAMAVTGTPETDMPGFWGAAIVMGIMGWSAVYVPRLVERIGMGVSVGLDHAAYHMSAGPVRSTAMRIASAPSSMLRRATGI